MCVKNSASFDLFGSDNSLSVENSSPLLEERSKTQAHEGRFKVRNESFCNFENSQNLTKNEDIES